MKPPHYWRTGRTVGRTIYDGDDNLIGVMDTPQLADRVVASVNWGLDNEQVLRSHQPGDNIQTVKVEVNIDTTKLDKILSPVPVDVTFVDAAGKEIPPDRLEFFVGLRDRVEVDLTEQMRLYASNLAESQVPHMGFLQPYPPAEASGKLTMKVTEDTWNKPETDVDADSVTAPEEEA